ncbi:MAG: SDR family NAD(P)-dependent oxidoreductase [Methylococcales bacterium]|nr:SDR family NAD(P)-dependent oxidoreductase [Methylococcales bacterium]
MLIQKKRIVIIGATSAIAEHCARLWVNQSPADLVLVGRDTAKIEQVAADLLIRSPESAVQSHRLDFTDPVQIRRLADEIADYGAIDIVLIAHGSLPDQAACQQDLAACREALTLNGISPVLFAEAFAGHMQKANTGALIIIGSVAGDRGRKSNYVYGSAKGLVTRYAQGLQHRLADSNVKVVLIKPGPTDTPMTRHLKQQGDNGLASVEKVAKSIVKGASRGQLVVYAPVKWAWIMMVVRHLPYFLFKRLNV